MKMSSRDGGAVTLFQLRVRTGAAGPYWLPHLHSSHHSTCCSSLVSPQFRRLHRTLEVPTSPWAFLVSGFPARQWVTRGHVPSQMVLYFWRGRGSVTICFLHVVSPEPEPIWINLCPIFSFMLHPTNLWDKRPLLHFTVWHTLGLNPWVEPNWPSTYLWAFA